MDRYLFCHTMLHSTRFKILTATRRLHLFWYSIMQRVLIFLIMGNPTNNSFSAKFALVLDDLAYSHFKQAPDDDQTSKAHWACLASQASLCMDPKRDGPVLRGPGLSQRWENGDWGFSMYNGAAVRLQNCKLYWKTWLSKPLDLGLQYFQTNTIIYIYMYVCMYVCMHACMHACMYVCMYVYIYI